MYLTIKTLYEQQWEFFSLKQIVTPYKLDKGNTQRNLQKLIQYKIIHKVPNSDTYTVDHDNNRSLQHLYDIIKLDLLQLQSHPNKTIIYHQENKLRYQELHHNRVEACLLFAHLIAFAEQKKDPKKRGIDHYNIMMYTIKDNMIDRRVPYEDMKNITTYLLEQTKKSDTNFLTERIKERDEPINKFFNVCKEVDKQDTETHTLKQLGDTFKQLADAYIDASSRASLVECSLFHTIPTIKKELLDYIQPKSNKDVNELQKEIAYITTPTVLTYVTQSELAILNICLYITEKHLNLIETICTQDYGTIANTIQKKYPDVYTKRKEYKRSHILGASFFKNKSRDFSSFIHIIKTHIQM